MAKPSDKDPGWPEARTADPDRTATRAPGLADSLPIPPGWVLNGVAVVSFALALWRGSERTGDLGTIVPIAGSWFLVLLVWLFKFVAGAGARTVNSSNVGRWGVVPVSFALAASLVFGGYALGARFRVSEEALNAAADSALAGGATRSGWIGLYPVTRISVVDGSVKVYVDGQYPLVRDAPAESDVPSSSPFFYDTIGDRWSVEIDLSLSD